MRDRYIKAIAEIGRRKDIRPDEAADAVCETIRAAEAEIAELIASEVGPSWAGLAGPIVELLTKDGD